jgi:hypothetical protein
MSCRRIGLSDYVYSAATLPRYGDWIFLQVEGSFHSPFSCLTAGDQFSVSNLGQKATTTSCAVSVKIHAPRSEAILLLAS